MKRPTIHDVPVRYCFKCGAKLITTEVHSGFDTETGNGLSRVFSTCPNKRWYNNHDHILWRYRYLDKKGKIEWIE